MKTSGCYLAISKTPMAALRTNHVMRMGDYRKPILDVPSCCRLNSTMTTATLMPITASAKRQNVK